jgi:hypothetical protein
MNPLDIAAPAPFARRRSFAGPISAALLALCVAACSDIDANPSSKPRVAYGTAQALGQGTARMFVALGSDNKPTALGVSISEAAMGTLPSMPMPGTPSAAQLTLALPDEAKSMQFDHVMLDWNPAGHEPEHVYTLPHFDVHFYSMTQAEQATIMPTLPDFATRANNVPDAQYAPPGYVAQNVLINAPAAAATVPMMGLHWIDGAASELHGQTFTSTFLWGSFDGRFIFIEPMITKAYIESAKTAPNNTIVLPLTAPAKYQRAGYYPQRYSITWDGSAKEYRISLDALVQRF